MAETSRRVPVAVARRRSGVDIIGPSVAGTPGGMATTTLALERALGARGIAVRLVESHREGTARTKIAVALRAGWLVTTSSADVAHFQVSTGASVWRKLLLAILARIKGTRVVVQLHGAEMSADLERSLGRRAGYLLLFRIAHSVLALGQPTARWLRDRHGVDARVIPNFLPTPSGASPLPDEPVLLFLGRVGKRKGVWDLLEASRRCDARGLRFRVVIAGDGELSELRARLRDRPATGVQIEVLGWVDADRARTLVATSTALVLPSYAEGLPMAILESLAAGRGAIATDVGSVADAVVDGDTGLLIAPGDVEGLASAMSRIVMEKPLAVDLGARARRHFDRLFSEVAVMDELLEVYAFAPGD